MDNKITDAQTAVAGIRDGSTICIGGGGAGHAVPDTLMAALGQRFLTSRKPANLTVFHPCGIGNNADRGLSHLAHEGLVGRAVGGFWGNSPKMVRLAQENKLEAYNFPQGVLTHLMRAAASGAPGVLTKTGLHTFVDPRVEGGRMNKRATEDLVEVVQFAGDEYLFYRCPRIDVALIRGSSIDKEGNLSMEEEVGTFAMLSLAQAARQNGGQVLAQVKRADTQRHTAPVSVKVPGVFIDKVVLEPNQGMTFLTPNEPALIRRDAPLSEEALALQGIPRLVARRAALELKKGAFVNLGYGMPDGVPIVAREEGVLQKLTFLIEQGALGGIPATGLNFGAMYLPQAILDDGYQFDFFHGGGLDLAFLGFAQIDSHGNVNSSRFGRQMTGCGGFIDISQHAAKMVFCGSFAVKGESQVSGNGLVVTNPGRYKKFVAAVEQITFSGSYARQSGQEVLYVTERAVFELTAEGVKLKELAPGVDLKKDVLDMMGFAPVISEPVPRMNSQVLSDQPLRLKSLF